MTERGVNIIVLGSTDWYVCLCVQEVEGCTSTLQFSVALELQANTCSTFI